MSKEIISKEDLKNLIQEKLSNSTELDGDCRDAEINSIYWHEPDETGSNWDIHSLTNARGCQGLVNSITSKFKEKYNIEEK